MFPENVLPHDLRPILVDDKPSILLLARLNLKRFGIIPVEFRNSQEALDHILALGAVDLKKDFLITDYDVPPLSGPLLAQRIRGEVHPNFPIIVISGRHPDDVKTNFPGLFDVIISKPYRIHQLVRAISELIK